MSANEVITPQHFCNRSAFLALKSGLCSLFSDMQLLPGSPTPGRRTEAAKQSHGQSVGCVIEPGSNEVAAEPLVRRGSKRAFICADRPKSYDTCRRDSDR